MMMDPYRISERDSEVLHALVEAYVELGTPVGSHALCAREGWAVSSATVRAILGRLERMGLVRQPHTSAGRVPTDRGYRVYVAQRIQADGFNGREDDDAQLSRAREELRSILRDGQVDEILAQLAQVVGEVSHQLGLVMAPRFDRGVLERLELVRLSPERILLVATIRRGLVRSLVIRVDSPTSREELEAVSRCLNERLAGLTLAQVRSTARERLREVDSFHGRLLEAMTDQIEEFAGPTGADLYVAGTRNICLKPEFHDPEQVAELMALVERRQELAHWLATRKGVVITIGHEHAAAAMHQCSVVTASFEVGGARGVIGVIGPTRMPYGHVVNLVSCAATQVAALAC